MSLTLASPPRITAAHFRDILAKGTDAGVSPIAPIAFKVYDLIAGAGLDPAIVLAIAARESQYGCTGIAPETKNIGNVRTPFHPELAIGQHPRGFAMYPDWLTGIRDLVDRLRQRYVANGYVTVEQVVTKYAPPIENDTAGYIQFVNSHVLAWQAEEAAPVTTSDGWYPLSPKVRHIPVPGFWQGNTGRKAAVMHIIVGSLQSCINEFLAGEVSAHFAFGQDGSIVQFVSIFDSAWANGASYVNGHWVSPEGNTISPPWVGMQPGVNPNKTTISFEHEGKPGDKWSDAMTQSNNEVLLWCAQQSGMHIERHVTLIGHNEISPVDRPNCPGPATPWDSMVAYCNPVPVPSGMFPVDVALRDYYNRSGGLWQPDRYALGYALTPLDPATKVQKFERGALRLRADGGIDALLRQEW